MSGWPSGAADRPAVELVDRRWIDDEVDDWVTGTRDRMLCLTAPPGFGKSMYVRLLIRRYEGNDGGGSDPAFEGKLLPHICRARDDASLDPLRFVEDLSARIARACPPFAKALVEQLANATKIIGTARAEQADHATVAGVYIENFLAGQMSARRAFDRLVRSPMEAAVQAGFERPLLIVVDGLDEALTLGGDETIADVLRPLVHADDRLPANVRLFLTFRSNEPRLDAFKAACTIDLGDRAQAATSDVRGYVKKRVGSMNAVVAPRVVDRIVELSCGNFLLAHHVLVSIEDGGDVGALDLQSLPTSLAEVFGRFLTRELASDKDLWLTVYSQALGVIAVSHGQGLSRRQIRGVLDCSATELDRALLRSRQFLAAAGEDGPFTFFHQTFCEFLVGDDGRWVDAGDAHERICRYLVDEHTGAWTGEAAAYARHYLFEHLIEAIESAPSRASATQWLEAGATLLGEPDFVQARISEVRPTGYLSDVSRWKHHPDYGRIAEQARGKLELLSEAVRLSGHILAVAPDQFASQIWSRIPREDGLPRTLLEEVEACAPGIWMRPRAPAATRIGTPLNWTFDGRIHVNALVVSTVAGRLALGNDAGNIVVYDLKDGSEVTTIATGASWIPCGDLHPDGKTAVFGMDGSLSFRQQVSGVLALDLETLEMRWSQTKGLDTGDVMISRDGRSIVSADMERRVAVHGFEDGEIERRLDFKAKAAVFLADSRNILAFGKGGARHASIDGDLGEAAWCSVDAEVALTLDGGRVALGDETGGVFVVDMDNETVRRLGDHDAEIRSLAWDNGSVLFSGGRDGSICAWDLETSKRLWSYVGHIMSVNCMAFANGTLYTGSKDCTVKAWDVPAFSEDPPKIFFDDFHQAIVLSPDERTVALRGEKGAIELAATDERERGGSERVVWKAHRGDVIEMAFDETSARLATAGADGMLKFWRIGDEVKLERKFSFRDRDYRYARARVDFGNAAAIVSDFEMTKILNWRTSKAFVSVPFDIEDELVLMDGGRRALTRVSDIGLAIVDLENERIDRVLRKEKRPKVRSDEEQIEWEVSVGIRCIAVDSDLRVAVIGKARGQIEIWDLEEGCQRTGPAPHVAHVHGLQIVKALRAGFSAGLEDRELRLWSLEDGEPLCRYFSDGGWWDAAVSKDGRLIVACDDDGGFKVFDVVGESSPKRSSGGRAAGH